MTRKRSLQTLLVLLFCLLPQTPARNPHHTGLSIDRNARGCVLCFDRITEFDCEDITPANAAMCRREVCPRCSYWSHCLPEWCPPPITTSTPTTSPTTTSPPTTSPPTTFTTTSPPTTFTTSPPTTSPTTTSPSTTSPPTTSPTTPTTKTPPDPADSSNSTTSATTDFHMG